MNRKIKQKIINILEYTPMLLLLRRSFFILKRSYEFFISVVFLPLPIKNNKIVFLNYYGKGVGDNAKYIYNELINTSLNVDIVWLVKSVDAEGKYSKIRFVKYKSFSAVYELLTAKIWINNCRFENFYIKRNRQFYIQTWHGGLILKKIEKDVEDKLGYVYVKMAKNDSKKTDLILSNSMFISDVIKNSFWYDGSILESGYPRSDILFEEKCYCKNKLRQQYGLNKDTKIILYAPTFRKNRSLEPYEIDILKVKYRLKKKDGANWVFAVRLHPNISSESLTEVFGNSVLNFTNYPDMQELIVASDILITDYSSCMFDSAMAKIPTFIYATDIKEYLDDRGFYFTLDELPFSVAENTEQLIKNISEFNQDDYFKKLDNFFERVGLRDDGNASKRIVDVIERVINGTYNKENIKVN